MAPSSRSTCPKLTQRSYAAHWSPTSRSLERVAVGGPAGDALLAVTRRRPRPSEIGPASREWKFRIVVGSQPRFSRLTSKGETFTSQSQIAPGCYNSHVLVLF